MSVWKFWNQSKQTNGRQKDSCREDCDVQDPMMADEETAGPSPQSSPNLEKQRLRHQMSVSRSGRYKQRQRKRSGILDNPDFVDSGSEQEKSLLRPENDHSTETSSSFCRKNSEKDRYAQVGKLGDYNCEIPRICDLQKRTDLEVIAI